VPQLGTVAAVCNSDKQLESWPWAARFSYHTHGICHLSNTIDVYRCFYVTRGVRYPSHRHTSAAARHSPAGLYLLPAIAVPGLRLPSRLIVLVVVRMEE